MSQKSWLLQETATGFNIACTVGDLPPIAVDISQSSTPEQTAETLWQSFLGQGYHGEPVVLAIRSQSCLTATIPHSGRSMARNQQAMAFAFEEFLPLAVEEITCDFILFKNDALAVAVEIATMSPLLSAMETHGVQVVSVTPAVLLALQHQIGKSKAASHEIILWQNGGNIDLLEMEEGKPRLWWNLSDDPETLARELKAVQLSWDVDSCGSFVVWGLSESLLEIVRRESGETSVLVEQPDYSHALIQAVSLGTSNSEPPWIELRRDSLGQYDPYRPLRGRLKMFALAAACCLILLTVTAWIHANQYAAIADQAQQSQEDIYRRVFPGKPLPVGITTRLASEYKKLAATKGHTEDAPRLESVTGLLHETLASLPEDIRYRLLVMNLEPRQIHLDGEVRQHGDADLLAAGLRKRGFNVESPHTNLMSNQGVSVTITASRGDQESTKKTPEGD